MFVMSLDIAIKFKANVFATVKVLSGQQIMWRESFGGAVGVRKGIEPKYCIGNNVNEHKAWNVFEWKGVIAAVSPVFYSATNVWFNLRNVLILGTKVETDLTKGLLKRFKFWGHDAKASTMIDLDDTVEASHHNGDLMVQQASTVPKCRPHEIVMRKGILLMNMISVMSTTC